MRESVSEVRRRGPSATLRVGPQQSRGPIRWVRTRIFLGRITLSIHGLDAFTLGRSVTTVSPKSRPIATPGRAGYGAKTRRACRQVSPIGSSPTHGTTVRRRTADGPASSPVPCATCSSAARSWTNCAPSCGRSSSARLGSTGCCSPSDQMATATSCPPSGTPPAGHRTSGPERPAGHAQVSRECARCAKRRPARALGSYRASRCWNM